MITRSRPVDAYRPVLTLPGRCQHTGCSRNITCTITTITTTIIIIMDANEFSHRVATFMFQEFRYKLCEVTGKTGMRSEPTPPMGIEGDLLRGCKHAVKVCLAAFTRPGKYLPYTHHHSTTKHHYPSVYGLGLPRIHKRVQSKEDARWTKFNAGANPS